MPTRQGFRRHQRGYFRWYQVYVDPAGLQLRFHFTMVASTSVPFVECPTRHVICPFLNLFTPTIEWLLLKINNGSHQMRVHARHAALTALPPLPIYLRPRTPC